MAQKPTTLAEGLFNRTRSRRRFFLTTQSSLSSPTEGSIISSSTTMRHQRPHSLHIGDDFMTQLVELQQANRELHEVLQHERGEVTKLKLQNEELARKLEEALREKHELESLLKPKKSKFSSIVDVLQLKFKNRPAKETLKQKHIFQNEPCFDNDLEKISRHEFTNLPKVLVECILQLESKPEHMREHGLYRVSGNHTTIQKLRFKIDANNYKLLHEQKDPHNITGVIKLFFRELKSPLISLKQLYEAIPCPSDVINGDRSVQVQKVGQLIDSLPKVNKETLRYLMDHLRSVAITPGNGMDAHTLSIVVGACIFYETMQDLNILSNLNRCLLPNKSLELMIDCYSDVFK